MVGRRDAQRFTIYDLRKEAWGRQPVSLAALPSIVNRKSRAASAAPGPGWGKVGEGVRNPADRGGAPESLAQIPALILLGRVRRLGRFAKAAPLGDVAGKTGAI